FEFDPSWSASNFFLSDGQDTNNNTDEMILDEARRAASEGVRIYTIGFGEQGQLNEPLLQEIASLTGGEYSYADPSVAVSLIAGFIKAEKARANLQQVWEWISKVAQGQTVDGGTFDVSGKGLLDVVLAWPGSTLELELTDPDGKQVGANYPGVKVVSTERTSQVFIENAKPGSWQVSVYGAETSMPEEPFYALASFKENTATPAAVAGGAPADVTAPVLLLLLVLGGAGAVAYVAAGQRRSTVSGASASISASPRLELVVTDAVSGTSNIAVAGGELTVGRADDADIRIRDPRVSRRHATLLYRDGILSVRDEGSSTGTLVNGEPVSTAVLVAGDTLVFGDSTIRIEAL
ncbi:MAG: FHA domain-containing protein, partial [Actinobacteria bacterium]